MKEDAAKKTAAMPARLIAPCGMNCRLCLGFIRETNRCPGCRDLQAPENRKSGGRDRCVIRSCEQRNQNLHDYCSGACDRFPCPRLRRLDTRYRTKYGMSMLANLQMIRESGIRRFIRNEKEKWACPECGALICVHRPACLSCGYERRKPERPLL